MWLMANILTFKAEYNPDIQEDVLQYQDYVLPLEMPCYKVVLDIILSQGVITLFTAVVFCFLDPPCSVQSPLAWFFLMGINVPLVLPELAVM